jgi:hypothetical protein
MDTNGVPGAQVTVVSDPDRSHSQADSLAGRMHPSLGLSQRPDRLGGAVDGRR